jgi:ricin-type beta-trefoil lectin protein
VYDANLWYLTAYGQLENAQAQKCLAIPNNSTANSTRLELEDCYGEPGEIWSAS